MEDALIDQLSAWITWIYINLHPSSHKKPIHTFRFHQQLIHHTVLHSTSANWYGTSCYICSFSKCSIFYWIFFLYIFSFMEKFLIHCEKQIMGYFYFFHTRLYYHVKMFQRCFQTRQPFYFGRLLNYELSIQTLSTSK